MGRKHSIPDEQALRRMEKRRVLAELKSAALRSLEERGYEVRGKTPSQIREALRRRPTNPQSQQH